MTRDEAKVQLDNGNSIRHETFLECEHIRKKGDNIINEDGNCLNPKIYWFYRRGVIFKTGWDLIIKD